MPGLQDPSPLLTCLSLHLCLRGLTVASGWRNLSLNFRVGAQTPCRSHRPGLSPRRLRRPGPARSAVPGLVLAAERLMVLRPLYLGFTILPTVLTPLCSSRSKPLQNFPTRKAPQVKHVGARTRATSLPLALRDFLGACGACLGLAQLRLCPAPAPSWSSNRQASLP